VGKIYAKRFELIFGDKFSEVGVVGHSVPYWSFGSPKI